jgi:nucleotide-binding universal stress UspA family protein
MSILSTTDLSDDSGPALRLAALLADELETLWRILHVVPEFQSVDTWSSMFEGEDEISRESLLEKHSTVLHEHLDELFTGHRHPGHRRLAVTMGRPADQIVSFVEEHDDIELVVGGTSGHGRFLGPLLGTTSNRLVRESPVPALFVHPELTPKLPERILAPVDRSECSRASLRYAASLARRLDARLYITHAIVVSPFDGDFEPMANFEPNASVIEKERRQELLDLLEELEIADVVDELHIHRRRPGEAIEEDVESYDIDLVCMGTHARGGVHRFFLGSTAERTLRNAPCPILTVRELEPQETARS